MDAEPTTPGVKVENGSQRSDISSASHKTISEAGQSVKSENSGEVKFMTTRNTDRVMLDIYTHLSDEALISAENNMLEFYDGKPFC